MLNKLQLFTFRNDVARYVKSYHIKRNVVNLNTHNSMQHETIKMQICYLLKQSSKEFYTEVPLQANYRKECYADILVLDSATIIEVLVSETLEQVKYKTEKYPRNLTIVAVRNPEEYFNGAYVLIREREV